VLHISLLELLSFLELTIKQTVHDCFESGHILGLEGALTPPDRRRT
jgi:hypothetical protein